MPHVLRSVTLTLLMGFSASADEPAVPMVKPQAAQLFAAGVIDAAGQIGYVDTGAGRIAAIELTSGKALWKSNEAMWPLIGLKNNLLVLVRHEKDMVLQWREPATGKQLRESDRITLPDWATRPIGLGPRCVVIEDELLLEWLVREDSDGGIPPLTGMGRVRIDLTSGKVAVVPLNTPDKRFHTVAAQEQKTIGTLTFSIIQSTEVPNPKFPEFVAYKRTLRAVDAAGKTVWERSLPTLTVGPPKP